MNILNKNIQTQNQQVHLSILQKKHIELWVKREDQIHEFVSGNKFRKLKYNIQEAQKQHKKTMLTFGGAYSNHIVATAVASKLSGLKSIGIIRGEELEKNLTKTLQTNNTLRVAHENGMKFEFVTRENFRRKNEDGFINELRAKFTDFYLVPEGGTNKLAVKGCKEILTKEDEKFNYICCSVGTGGTIAGIINSTKEHQKVIGFSALKGNFLSDEIKKRTAKQESWSLQTNYHFGGYAKYNTELIRFINDFRTQTQVPLDPIYTGKMLFGLLDNIWNNKIPPNSKVLAIHTGGLQGISGINQQLKRQGKMMIEI